MPNFSFTSPDGTQYSVDGPEGATAEQAFTVLQHRIGDAGKPPAPPVKFDRRDPRFSSGGMASEKALEGVPILGGLIPKAGAAISALAQPMTGAGAPGESFGERYAKNLEQEASASQTADIEHPLASTAAQLVGGAVATAPLAATGVGAKLLGLGGKSLGSSVIQSGVSGAGINALDAVVRGNDPLTAAGIGGGIGLAAPPAARIAGAIASPIINTVRATINPTAEAARRVSRSVDLGQQVARETPNNPRNALTPQEFQAAQAQGEPVNLMDLGGEPGTALARSAANVSPEGRAILQDATNQRFESQSDRTAEWFNNGLHYPTEDARNQAIRGVAENVYEPRYAQAYKDSASVPLWNDRDLIKSRANAFAEDNTRPPPFNDAQKAALQNLQDIAQAPEVQTAIKLATPQLRNWAVRDGLKPPPGAFAIDNSGTVPRTVLTQTKSGNVNLPSLQYWDYIKRGLDRIGSPTSMQFSKILRDSLDTLVPSYQAARAAAQPTKFFNGAPNAYEAGRNFVNNGQRFGSGAQTQIGNMTTEEQKLFQDGYTSAIVDKINKSGDRRNIVNQVYNSPAARTELQTALGPQRATELEAKLRLEGLMDSGRQAVQGNSTSVRQLVELGLAGGTGVIEGGNPLNWDTETLMHAAMVYSAAKGKGFVDQNVAKQVARLLASNNPAQIKLGMSALTRNQGLMNGLRGADAALARSAAVQMQPQAQQAQAR